MSSIFGNSLKVSIFGQSHGQGIGVVMDGLPPGEPVDLDALQGFLNRRAPGGPLSTSRREADVPEILSGLVEGVTCGAPLCAVIRNTDARSGDYGALGDLPRPGHADYSAHMRYHGHADLRGGGHFSGRLTAPLCIAGGIALQILAKQGIKVFAHILSIGSVSDRPFDPMGEDAAVLDAMGTRALPVLTAGAEDAMRAEIEAVHAAGDSVGGVVECMAVGVVPGIGDPMFDGVENRLAQILFGIPAVKGVAFGAGYDAARLRGSQHNDAFVAGEDGIGTATNRHGGILGGITTGMPIVFTAAFKPTPSIAMAQQTVRLSTLKPEEMAVKGRHDPCIVPRAVPCVEAAAAVGLLDLILSHSELKRG